MNEGKSCAAHLFRKKTESQLIVFTEIRKFFEAMDSISAAQIQW